jgi:CDP-diacylglycerol---glycerol-3-phosphate 3-phosphatidyltransferase
MTRHIPNLLTASRFFMAIALFIILSFYDARTGAGLDWDVLDICFVVFLVGVCTDMVDGYLARALGHLTTFGRIADPFVDKIIICGTLIYFAGSQFIDPADPTGNLTGWKPWMVVVIIARELLVTGMRSFSESHSLAFAATLSGKVKMIIQCVAICWSIFYAAHWTAGPEWTRYARDIFVWTTTIFTGLTGLVYVRRAYQLLKMPPD